MKNKCLNLQKLWFDKECDKILRWLYITYNSFMPLKKIYLLVLFFVVLFLEQHVNAVGDPWAPSYDFEDERAWQKYITQPLRLGTFDADPEFLAETRILRSETPDLQASDELTGLAWLRFVINKIGGAPTHRPLVLHEIKFLRRELMALAMTIQMKMNPWTWISQQKRSLGAEEEHSATEKLGDDDLDLPSRIVAKKTALYARIPWRLIEAIGKLASRLNDEERVTTAEKQAFHAALPYIVKDFRQLSESFADLIHFHQNAREGHHELILSERKAFPAIEMLGTFSRDFYSLRRIKNLVKTLYEFKEQPMKQTKQGYMVLRILNIIGECNVTFSPHVKVLLFTGTSWQAFQSLRNSFHEHHAQAQLHTAILDEKVMLPLIIKDLAVVSTATESFNLFSNFHDWENLKGFYTADPTETASLPHLIDIVDLDSRIHAHLTEREIVALQNEVRLQFAKVTEPAEYIRKILLEDATVDRHQRQAFMDQFDGLKLSKGARTKLMNAYKKRCTLESQGENSVLDTKNRGRVEAALESVLKNQNKLKKLTKEIHSYTTWEHLEKKLSKYGVTGETLLKPWKDAYQLVVRRRPLTNHPHLTTKERTVSFCNAIETRITHLHRLFQPYHKIPASKRFDYYHQDKGTQFAAEYLVGSFRQYAQQLWDLLSKAENNNKATVERGLNALDFYIQRAKAILHNHDITEVTSIPEDASNVQLLFKDIPVLLGDFFDLDFILTNGTMNISLKTGELLVIPVIDVRETPPKSTSRRKKARIKQNRRRREFLQNYRLLTNCEKHFANLIIESQKKYGPLTEYYRNLTIDKRFVLYTPPRGSKNNLVNLLRILKSRKVQFK